MSHEESLYGGRTSPAITLMNRSAEAQLEPEGPDAADAAMMQKPLAVAENECAESDRVHESEENKKEKRFPNPRNGCEDQDICGSSTEEDRRIWISHGEKS